MINESLDSGTRIQAAEEELLNGEAAAATPNELQIRLAKEYYARWMTSNSPTREFDIEAVAVTPEGRNQIMEEWEKMNYSKALKALMDEKGFATHPRFQGDFRNITLSDIEYYVIGARLPKE